MIHHFAFQMDPPYPIPLSVALVSCHDMRPVSLAGVSARLVREPHELRPSDDVILFYGSGMAQRLRCFSDKAEGLLPPAVVLAHGLDWDDVRLALDSGAVGYLLENRYAYLLAEALWCAARGSSILDPEIAAEQVRVAVRARADEEERTRTTERTKSAASADRLQQLSRRERQVMELLVSGRGVSDVAREMFLTDKTVRNYLSRIYVKLNARCLSEAILYWLGHLDAPSATDTPEIQT